MGRSLLLSSAVVYGLGRSPVASATSRVRSRPTDARSGAEQAWLAAAPAPLVLRPSAFIGPERLGVFGILFRWVREGRCVYVLGDGSTATSCSTSTISSALVLAAEHPCEGVVNVGGRVSGTVREDLEELIRHADSTSRVVGVPAGPRAALAVLAAARLSPLGAGIGSRRTATSSSTARGAESARLGAERGRGGAARAYDWFCAEGAKRRGDGHRSAGASERSRLLRRLR